MLFCSVKKGLLSFSSKKNCYMRRGETYENQFKQEKNHLAVFNGATVSNSKSKYQTVLMMKTDSKKKPDAE